MGTVTVEECPSIRIGKFLLSSGYNFGEGGYLKNSVSASYSYDIALRGYQPPKPGLLSRVFLGQPRRRILGTIWFKSFGSQDADDQNWLLVVYGSECLDQAKELAEEMVSTFPDVNITISLRNMIINESFAGDGK